MGAEYDDFNKKYTTLSEEKQDIKNKLNQCSNEKD